MRPDREPEKLPVFVGVLDRNVRTRQRTRAATALTISLLVHAALISQLPPPGWLPKAPMHRRPIIVRDAPTLPVERIPQRPVFDPDRPDALRPSPAPNVETPPLPEIPDRPVPPFGESDRLTSIEMPPPAAWTPRLDRLETEQRVVPEGLAALPRRIDVAVPRAQHVPDITPSAFFPSEIKAELPPRSEQSAFGTDLSWPPPSGSGREIAAVHEEFARELNNLWQPETSAEVTGARAIESLLRMETRTHRLPSDSIHLYFEIRIQRRSAEGLPIMPKDVLLVQDCSESMTQPILDQCQRGLHLFLATLAPEDRFDIIAFAETRERCFGALTPADAVNRARAGWFIAQLTSRGKTDLLAFLDDVVPVRPDPGRAFLVVLFTDGIPTTGLMDNFVIIERFTERNTAAVSVFTFGAGRRVNRFLLDLLSYRNRGDARVIPERQNIPAGVAALATELARPVLTELRVSFAGDAGKETYPRTLTNLYLDRPLILYGRVRIDAPPTAVHIRGRSLAGDLDMVFPIVWEEAQVGGPEIVTEWARQRMLALMAEYVRTRNPVTLTEWARVGRAYGIPLPYVETLNLPISPARR